MFIKKSEFEELKCIIEDLESRVDYLEYVDIDKSKDCSDMKLELMKLLNNLNNKVELLEFKQENPLGMAIIKKCYLYSTDSYLKYIKDNKLKEFYLTNGVNDFELDKNGHIIETSIDKRLEYKFDIDREILIQISEKTMPIKNEQTKKGNNQNDK